MLFLEKDIGQLKNNIYLKKMWCIIILIKNIAEHVDRKALDRNLINIYPGKNVFMCTLHVPILKKTKGFQRYWGKLIFF